MSDKANHEKQWCFSYDGERFDSGFYDTKADAIVAGIKDIKIDKQGQNHFFVGQCYGHSAEEFLNAADIIENAQERAYDEAGEWSENWLDTTQEQIDDLQHLLNQWVEKHKLEPTFYNVTNIEEIKI